MMMILITVIQHAVFHRYVSNSGKMSPVLTGYGRILQLVALRGERLRFYAGLCTATSLKYQVPEVLIGDISMCSVH